MKENIRSIVMWCEEAYKKVKIYLTGVKKYVDLEYKIYAETNGVYNKVISAGCIIGNVSGLEIYVLIGIAIIFFRNTILKVFRYIVKRYKEKMFERGGELILSEEEEKLLKETKEKIIAEAIKERKEMKEMKEMKEIKKQIQVKKEKK